MSEQTFETSKIFLYGFVLIILTMIINVGNYLIFSSIGAYEGVINSNTGNEIPLLEVVFASIGQSLVGLLVFFALVKLVSEPLQKWRIIGIIALLLSLFIPLTVEGDDTLIAIISLELMHIVSGLAMIFGLPMLLQRE